MCFGLDGNTSLEFYRARGSIHHTLLLTQSELLFDEVTSFDFNCHKKLGQK